MLTSITTTLTWGVHSLEQKLILAAYLADERRNTSPWVASLPTLPCPNGKSLEDALLNCIKNATQGWDRVLVPGLEIATVLIDLPPRQGMEQMSTANLIKPF